MITMRANSHLACTIFFWLINRELKALLVPDGWYVVLDSKEVSTGRPMGIQRLGEPMVFWRDAI